MEECSARDRGAAGSSLTGITHSYMTERFLIGRKESIKQKASSVRNFRTFTVMVKIYEYQNKLVGIWTFNLFINQMNIVAYYNGQKEC